jgi:Fe-S cluster biosynthesis and repair protein YggX
MIQFVYNNILSHYTKKPELFKTFMIFCQKLQQNLPKLKQAPYPGELGTQILNSISQPAWNNWLGEQTKLINENRLILADPKTREFLTQKMKDYLFGN